MNASAVRPVVALDLDGVLNRMFAGYSEHLAAQLSTRDTVFPTMDDIAAEGWGLREVDIPIFDETGQRNIPESPYLRGHGQTPMSGSVLVNPQRHGPWITRLREEADVVWATTWEQAANVGIAPALDIDPLVVGITVAESSEKGGLPRESVNWKADALARKFAGHPLVWIDDHACSFARYWPERTHDPTLVIAPNSYTGLTTTQMAEVDTFLTDPRRSHQGQRNDGPDTDGVER